jgi:hypothetical protein
LIIGSDIFSGGTTAPATAPVLVACYVRLAPVIVRTATAIGAAEAYRASIDHTRATFSRIGGERGEGAGAGKSGGESGPQRTEPVGERGAFWQSLRPKPDEAQRLAALQRKAINKQDEIRFDGRYYYQFDRFHKGKHGEHIHRYVKKGNEARLDAEIDPQTGRVIKLVKDARPEYWF